MNPTNPPNVKRLRYHPPLNVKRRRPNVNFLGFVLDNDDLLTEILLRLPVKSLSRFKSVCKKWLSIISSDYFCHQHTLRRPRLQPSLILQMIRDLFYYLNPTANGGKKMIPYRMSFPDCRDGTIVLTCNGLSLLHFNGVKRYLSNEGCYYVHNLTTRRSRKISLNRNNEHPSFEGIGLAFDPSKSPYYKIVCVYPSNPKQDRSSYDELMTSYQIEVYDSKSHSWKPGLEAASVPKIYCSGDCGTHWNNKIYWPSRIGYCYFDIDKNEMKTLSFPETGRSFPETGRSFPETGRPFLGLRESNGHLYHCEYESRESVAVWELVGNDDGPTTTSPWLLKHHAPVDRYSSIVGLMAGSDGDETCSLLTLNHSGWNIRVYSFRDQTHEELRYYFTGVTGFQFGETLALV